MGAPEDEQVPPGASTGLPPPNWYPDPQNSSRYRYWDGTRWTEHTRPLAGPAAAPTYRPLITPARTLFVLFAVTLVLTVIALLSGWLELSLLGRIVEDPASVSPAEANASDQRQSLIGLLQLLLYLGTVVAFLVWFRRAYRNLPALGTESLRFSSGWAVGAWFVPFLNLVRPKQLADDIWRATDPLAATLSNATSDEMIAIQNSGFTDRLHRSARDRPAAVVLLWAAWQRTCDRSDAYFKADFFRGK